MLRDLLQLQGIRVGRKHVATVMRRMGIETLYRYPRTTRSHPDHQVFPYLLRRPETGSLQQIELKINRDRDYEYSGRSG